MKKWNGLVWVVGLLILMLSISALSLGCGDDDDDDDDSATPDDDDTTDDDDDDVTDDDDDDVTDDDDDDVTDDDDDDTVDNIDLVDPFIGTGGFGFDAANLMPAPQWPNGMVRPSPDTSIGGLVLPFQHFCGYWYPETTIRGFSHTRVVGTGANDMGNMRFMPILGFSDAQTLERGYRATFEKENEEASTGYYRVLMDNGIQVELAAGRRVAVHRYTFPADEDPFVIVDVGASIINGDVEDAEVTVDPGNRTIIGYADQHGGFSGRYGGLPTYFVAEFSEDFVAYGTFKDGVHTADSTNETGINIGAYIGFAPETKSKEIIVKVAISFIDENRAFENMASEFPGFVFENAVQANRDAWAEKLDVVETEGGTQEQRKIFYTALYHAYMMPTLFTEGGSTYMGFDGQVHIANGFTYYTDMSLWDSFRTLHPLMTLIDPDRSRDFVISLISMYEQGGDLPRWPQGRGYGSSMIGTHSDSVITEAYIKGVGDFDVDTAYEGMYLHATETRPHAGRDDIDHYITEGYVAEDHRERGASRTVEYAYDDYCVGTLAAELGHADDAAMFMGRADNYVNVWDPVTLFIRSRYSDGSWYTPFFPAFPMTAEYVEGNAWHWSWFVPHDAPGLIALFPDVDSYVEKLNQFFQGTADLPDTFLPDPYYWHGNEPDIHSAYMFNEAGRPDLTAKWARWVMENRYYARPDGLDGNDDGGTLSSWYVFSALGFFPLNPCDGRYMIGSPIFTHAVVHLPGGDLEIIADNASEQNIYVQSATLDGQPLEVSWFHHDDIKNGAVLHFVMGPDPSDWAQEIK